MSLPLNDSHLEKKFGVSMLMKVCDVPVECEYRWDLL